MVANIVRTTATGATPRLIAPEVVVGRGEDVVPRPVVVGVVVGTGVDVAPD
jgi:hypothetical protein